MLLFLVGEIAMLFQHLGAEAGSLTNLQLALALVNLNDFKNLAGTKPGQPAKARFRIRRCPGFKLLTQTFAYHVKKGRKYHITVIRKNKELSIAVDGKVYLKAVDPKPFKSGYWGFRTYRTYLWFSNALIKQL